MKQRLHAALLAAFLLVPAVTAQSLMLPPGAEDAAQKINPGALDGAIRFLADDLLEGRGPATRGDELTRLYLATSLQRLGLEPGAADGTWQQKVDVVSVDATAPKTWQFRGPGSKGSAACRWRGGTTSSPRAASRLRPRT